MKLQDLNVLMTVMQTGSMGKAAQRLHTSQPAVSRSISEMERTLGVPLLDRHRQGVEPTEYGRALLDCGVAVFDDLRRGIKSIEFLADPTSGEVRIGTGHALAPTFVSSVVDRLCRHYPRISFHLRTTDWEILHRELFDRNVDLLVAQKFGLFSDDRLNFETLYDTSYVVVAGAQNPWARRRKIALGDLMNELWVLPYKESAFGAAAHAAFRASGFDFPSATVFADEADVRLTLLRSGRLLSVFTTAVLDFSTQSSALKVLPVTLPNAVDAPVGIVTLRNRALNPVAQRFIAAARDVAKPLMRGK